MYNNIPGKGRHNIIEIDGEEDGVHWWKCLECSWLIFLDKECNYCNLAKQETVEI